MSLSARRAKFVNEYLLDFNGSRAARAAGYSVKSAHVAASRMLRNDKVIAAIALKTAVLANQYELNKYNVINEIRAAIALAETKFDPNAMIRGWTEIGKILGFYAPEVIKTEVKNEDSVMKLKLEAMTDEELIEISQGTS